MNPWTLIAVSWVAMALLMSILWELQRRLGKAAMVDAAWAAGELAEPGPDEPVRLQAGVALQADDLDPYMALIRLVVVTLLVQLELLGAESLREVQVGEGMPGTIAVSGLKVPREALVELLGSVVRDEDDTP